MEDLELRFTVSKEMGPYLGNPKSYAQIFLSDNYPHYAKYFEAYFKFARKCKDKAIVTKKLARLIYHDFQKSMYETCYILVKNPELETEVKKRYPYYNFVVVTDETYNIVAVDGSFAIRYPDELPLRNLDIWNYVLKLAKGIIYISDNEADLVRTYMEEHNKKIKKKFWRFW